ncbi:MAG: hypothetical protein KGM42_07865 [Hyphomicrobiales bacterium]|nr:hypothetical protein [Hyphomicrobiales bacterium]
MKDSPFCHGACREFDFRAEEYATEAGKFKHLTQLAWQLQQRIDRAGSEIAKMTDDLYYLEQDIQSIGRERTNYLRDLSGYERDLDASTDEYEQRNLRYKIDECRYKADDCEKRIEAMRRDQQSQNAAKERRSHEMEGWRLEQDRANNDKIELEMSLQRQYRALETALSVVARECDGYEGRSMPARIG